MTSQIIEAAYRNFSLYTLEDRALLYFEDGLRASIRRGIWVSKNLPKTKTATVAGYMMPLHPHGEADEVLQNFTSPFKMNYPYFNGNDAGFGTLLEPSNFSASRYTSIELSEFAKDVILADANLITMVPNYDEEREEPAFLLPLVPLHLLNGISGMAVGFKCSIVPYNIVDIIEQQINVLSNKPQDKIIPYFRPLDQYAVASTVSPKGNVIWTFEGSVTKIKRDVWQVNTLPYGVKHSDFIKHLHDLIESGVVKKYVDNSKKQVNCDVFFKQSMLDENEVKNILGLRNNRTEIINLISYSEQKVKKFEVNELINDFTLWRMDFYKQRIQKQIDQLKQEMARLQDIIKTVDLIVKGKLNISKVHKAEMMNILTSNGVINTEYIASLPVYRFNIDNVEAIKSQILQQQTEIAELELVLHSDAKIRKLYISELRNIQKKFLNTKQNKKTETKKAA